MGATNDYVKRIIGLPGEKVEIKSGQVIIHKPDGQLVTLDESEYVADPAVSDYLGAAIPDGHYFVMGDNRNNSGDSRNGWTVSASEIVGRAWLVVWPLSEMGSAPNYDLPAGLP